MTQARRRALGVAMVSFAELWERASFYSLSGVMALYAIAKVSDGGLGWTSGEADKLSGTYTLLAFGLPVFLGIVGDRLTGHYRAVVLGGCVIVTGHATLFVTSGESGFWAGLLLVAAGTGLLKPAMPCLVSSFYPEQQLQRDQAFKWYYLMINLGAAMGPIVAGFFSFKWAFLWAGLGMMVALVLLVAARSLVPMVERGPPQHGGPERDEEGDPMTGTRLRRNLTVLFVLFGLFLVWALSYGVFAGTSDTELIAKNFVDRSLDLGFTQKVPTVWLNSIEPTVIVVATPLITLAIAAAARRGWYPSMPAQMVFGGLLSTAALIGLAYAVRAIPVGDQEAPVIALGTFVGLYAIMSIGEIFISPVYMALITRLAPRRLQATFQGMCLLAIGLLGFAASRIGAAAEADGGAERFGDYLVSGVATLVLVALFIPVVPWMKRTIRKWNPGHGPGGGA
ncbi:MAG: MFS transporter [Phycisphaerales bacterium]|nr:MFS transporter [Phycisphaerales bacterium]